MRDQYMRIIDYMRISVTDRCNLRCRYCMPEETPHIPEEEILSFEEILLVCRAAVLAGIRNIRVTGGEPLAREGVVPFIKELKSLPGIEHVAMTTNGVRLGPYLEELDRAGIDGINISLDSMKPERYASITGGGRLSNVMDALDRTLDLGIPAKINCVPIQEFNEDELYDFVELAFQKPVDVRFIELMPTGYGRRFSSVDHDRFLQSAISRYGLTPSAGRRGFGPAVYYTSDGMKGNVGFIRAIHHKFCDQCNRVRLTASGFLRLCLFDEAGMDVRRAVRGGIKAEELAKQMEQEIYRKPREHHMTEDSRDGCFQGLSEIGG